MSMESTTIPPSVPVTPTPPPPHTPRWYLRPWVVGAALGLLLSASNWAFPTIVGFIAAVPAYFILGYYHAPGLDPRVLIALPTLPGILICGVFWALAAQAFGFLYAHRRRSSAQRRSGERL